MRPAGVLGRCPGVMSEIHIIIFFNGQLHHQHFGYRLLRGLSLQMVLFLLDEREVLLALGVNVVAKRLRCAEVLFLPITYELPRRKHLDSWHNTVLMLLAFGDTELKSTDEFDPRAGSRTDSSSLLVPNVYMWKLCPSMFHRERSLWNPQHVFHEAWR